MPTSSTRLSMDKPLGPDSVAQLRLSITDVIDILDPVAVIYDQGAVADRPISSPGTPGVAGRFYDATDEDILYFDYGTGWRTVNGAPFNTVMSFTRSEDDVWPASGKKVGHFRVRLAGTQTIALASVEHMLDSGSGTVFAVQKNGTNITGWTGITPTTSQAQSNPTDEVLADGDRITVVCTTRGTGKGGYFELVLLHTV